MVTVPAVSTQDPHGKKNIAYPISRIGDSKYVSISGVSRLFDRQHTFSWPGWRELDDESLEKLHLPTAKIQAENPKQGYEGCLWAGLYADCNARICEIISEQ